LTVLGHGETGSQIDEYIFYGQPTGCLEFSQLNLQSWSWLWYPEVLVLVLVLNFTI